MKLPVKPSTRLLAVALTALLATSVDARKWECGERSNLPPDGKNYCAAGDFRQAEINLAKVLKILHTKHQRAYGDASALMDAQNAFESYRDNQCVAENKRIKDKPFHPMIVAQCKTRLTNLRIDELHRMRQKLK